MNAIFNLTNYKPPAKMFGNVRGGWHRVAKIYAAEIKNGTSKDGKPYRYTRIDFCIDGILVPAFFPYKKSQEKPHPLFGKLLSIAGMLGRDYRGDRASLFKGLIGTEL